MKAERLCGTHGVYNTPDGDCPECKASDQRLVRRGSNHGAGTTGRYGCPMCKLKSDNRELIRDHVRTFDH